MFTYHTYLLAYLFTYILTCHGIPICSLCLLDLLTYPSAEKKRTFVSLLQTVDRRSRCSGCLLTILTYIFTYLSWYTHMLSMLTLLTYFFTYLPGRRTQQEEHSCLLPKLQTEDRDVRYAYLPYLITCIFIYLHTYLLVMVYSYAHYVYLTYLLTQAQKKDEHSCPFSKLQTEDRDVRAAYLP